MGDRSPVCLTVLHQHVPRVKEIALPIDGKPSYEASWGNDGLYDLQFDEVNYGELNCLSVLREQGIAYNSSWEAGAEFSKGAEYCRFTDKGAIQTMVVYDHELGIPPERLLPLLDNYDELKKYILFYRDMITPLPWDGQAEYGQLHRVMKLIDPAAADG